MASVQCFKCGRVNSSENITCDFCEDQLLRGKEYEEKLQELKDYEEFRKKYNILGIILVSIVLFLMYPVVIWLVQAVFSVMGTEFLPAVIIEYAPPAIILLTFVIAVLPMMFGRWKIQRKYRWTSRRMWRMKREMESLPKNFLKGLNQKMKKV